MLEQMIKNVIEKLIQVRYQHVKLPATVYAKITKAQEYTDYYVYNLKILNENKAIDTSFPEIPEVMSKEKLETGDVAAVLLLYGKLNVFVVGKVI